MEALRLAGVEVPAGTRQRVDLPVGLLPTHAWVDLSLEIVHGAKPGPRLWLSAAVHGDEVNGVEIIRQVLEQVNPAEMSGSLIAAPIVNAFGFLNQSRYLPDRRDLNRCFPGSAHGSLASRIAHLFMREVVSHCTHGIDLHTGSHYRSNMPQIRANLRDAETLRIAESFGAPVLIQAKTPEGSLRASAAKLGIPILVFEGGEPLEFDAWTIEVGVAGILRVMHRLGLRKEPGPTITMPPRAVGRTSWLRARRGGILRLAISLGERVEAKQELGEISDAWGENGVTVRAPSAGLVIGLSNNPLVHQGDSIVHLGDLSAPIG